MKTTAHLREYDVDFETTHIHFYEGGSGFPVLLLHGSGPGVSTLGNFVKVLDGLCSQYHVVAMDWIGFGKSGRLSSEPFFDMDLWQRQIHFGVERIEAEEVGILAHSLAVVFALREAATNPRVTRLLLTGGMGTPLEANDDLHKIWTFPEDAHMLRQALETLVYDQSLLTEEFVVNRFQHLQRGEYKEYFSSMFSGDKQRYVDASVLPDELFGQVEANVILMHGQDDRIIPVAETTLVMANALPKADAWVIGRCGHSPALEYPEKLLAAARVLYK